MSKQPSKIVEELKRIARENDGILKAETVVKVARHPASPLHDSFTWDDDEAAERWRLHQARNLIRVSVEYLNTGEVEPMKVSAFVSLTTDREQNGGGYRLMVNVMNRKETREQLLNDALAELQVFESKYAALTELAAVFEASRKARKRIAA